MKTLITIVAIAFTTIYSLYFYHFHDDFSPKQETWGQFGDFIGGSLNPILTFITIYLLYKTIALQREALDKSNDALNLSEKSYALSKRELRLSRNEFSKSSKVLEAQNELISSQRFEGAFFELINLLIEETRRSEYFFEGHKYSGSSGADKLIHDLLEIIESDKSTERINEFLDNDNDLYSLAKQTNAVFRFIKETLQDQNHIEKYLSLFTSILPPSSIYALCFIYTFADWPTMKHCEDIGFFERGGIKETLESMNSLKKYKTV